MSDPRPVPPLAARRSFVRRFWRGEVSLAVSYWGVGLIVILIVAVMLSGVSFVMHRQAFNPYVVVAALVVIWGTMVIGLAFQSVGVWRSAARHRRVAATEGKSGNWGLIAQAVVGCGLCGLGFTVATQAVPQFAESWRMAFEGDPDIPAYSMRLMRGNTEAEITGGFKHGLATEAARLFATAPGLKVVHLNSGGGRLGEAMELAKLIRARGLATYTSTSCTSACTIAFAAARERYLKSGAKLGFHRAIFAGTESTEEMRGLLRDAGIEASFADRAVAESANSIWYPSERELADAHVIVAVVDSYRYAASGLGVAPTLDDFKAALRLSPGFAALEVADAQLFEDTADLYQRRYFEGTPEGQIADEIRATKFAPLLRARLVTAPDELLIAYANLMADQFEALGARDARACFVFATRAGSTETVLMLPAELRQRDEALAEKTLRATGSRPPADSAEAGEASIALSQALIARFDVDKVRLLTQPGSITPGQYPLFCQLSAGMFRTIAGLPPRQAGTEMSSIFGAMAKAAK